MSRPRIGVYVCNCGTNIAKTIDCEELTERAASLPGVVCARSYKYVCSNPGQEMIVKDIRDKSLDRVVVAACSPRMHEQTFRGALEAAGLNPYLLQIANIREQCSWVHDDRRSATDKAADLMHAAVRRVAHHSALERREARYLPATLVIGGGVAGLTAAAELALAGQTVHLVERSEQLGGNLARVDLTAPYLDSAQEILDEKIRFVTGNPNVRVLTGAELVKLEGYLGNFFATVRTREGTTEELPVGSAIVCTGYREFDAAQVEKLGYGSFPDVITSFEFEKRLRSGDVSTAEGKPPRCVTIVHCVGSRHKRYHPYCSRVCCMTALKYGHEIKSACPEATVVDAYVDMLAFGKGGEQLYRRTSELKTMFLMYEKEDYPNVRRAEPGDGCNLLVRVREMLSGETIDVPTDLVILMVGMEAREDAGRIARQVGISQDREGWFIESHPKLAPVATTTDGIYIAGACQSPKDVPDSVAQARAAAASVLAHIARGRIEIDARYAEVDPEHCSGCRVCNELCPFSAIEFDAVDRRSHVVSALCKACGTCVAACPSGAIEARHFTDAQIFAEIEGVTSWASNRG